MFEEEDPLKFINLTYNYYEPTVRIEKEYSGIYSLFYAVLERAIQDYIGVTDPHDNQTTDYIKLSARNWLESNEMDAKDHFTFFFVCEALDLDPLYIRAIVFGSKDKDIRNPKSGGKLKSRTSRNHKILNEILELY